MLQQYTTSGALDTNFGSAGTTSILFGDFYSDKNAAVLQPDGKIVVAGTTAFANENGAYLFATARFNANGSLDTGFGIDGKVTSLIDNSCSASAIFIQPDGKIIVAGKSYNAGVNFSSIRYNTNGTLDQTYGSEGKISSQLADYLYDVVNSIWDNWFTKVQKIT